MNNRSLNVIQVRVMLQRPLQQPGLFAQLSDMRSIIMSEHLISQNRVRDLRRLHQIHFQQSRLQWTFAWSIIFQCFQQKRRTLLDQLNFHEAINNLKIFKVSTNFFWPSNVEGRLLKFVHKIEIKFLKQDLQSLILQDF